MATPSTSVVPFEKPTIRRPELTNIIPPVDFSFLHISSVDECENEEPRDNSPRKGVAQKKKKTTDDDVEDKSQSQCLRLNNNQLKDVNNLMTIAVQIFEHATNIGWIDLSFNVLTNIDPVLTQFENLKILYLHGNNITEQKEVNKLASIAKLWKLTLHGNAIEDIKGYRLFVLTILPGLTSLDFSRVTKADRVTANTWSIFNNPKRSKKSYRDD